MSDLQDIALTIDGEFCSCIANILVRTKARFIAK